MPIDFYNGRVDPEGIIKYHSGNKLEYLEDKNDLVSEGSIFVYYANKRRINLRDLLLVPEHWAFVPVDTPFAVCFNDCCYRKQRPEIQLNVNDLKHEIEILVVLHEIGHSRLYDERWKKYLAQQRNPEFFQGGCSIAEQLSRANSGFHKNSDDRQAKKIEERFAWAFALKTRKRLQLLPGLDNNGMAKYYQSYLQTYDSDDVKFTRH